MVHKSDLALAHGLELSLLCYCYHYILTIIDVLSKYGPWTVPLKSKSGSETVNAITEIIRKSGRQPKNLQTDTGKEFYNADMQRLVNKHGINHYSTYSVMKASVVKRFNRTLKNMWKMFTLNGNYKWIDLLSRLVSNYNARKHRTIGMRPVVVTPAVAERLFATVYSAIKIAGPAKFKVGDSIVLILLSNNILERVKIDRILCNERIKSIILARSRNPFG